MQQIHKIVMLLTVLNYLKFSRNVECHNPTGRISDLTISWEDLMLLC